MTFQPVRNNIKKRSSKKYGKKGAIVKSIKKIKTNHPEYGTSKLEEKFAKDFLDKLGVKYKYQYYAEDIKRYFDFKIIDGPIIEVNGSYWHGDRRIYEEKDLNFVQRKNVYVDELKKKWALSNGIPIYYVWEKDINENPVSVMDYLKHILSIDKKKDRKRK